MCAACECLQGGVPGILSMSISRECSLVTCHPGNRSVGIVLVTGNDKGRESHFEMVQGFFSISVATQNLKQDRSPGAGQNDL